MTLKQSKSWWDRHWKWVVPSGCLGCLGLIVAFIVGIAFLVFSALTSTDVYRLGVERAQGHPQVIEALGEPVTTGWMLSGSVNVSGPSGDADLSIPLEGPEGTATLYIVANKEAGIWNFTILEVEIEGEAERIDLLLDADGED